MVADVDRLERTTRRRTRRRGDEVAPELADEERAVEPMADAEAAGVLPVVPPALAEDPLAAGVVALAVVAEVDGPLVVVPVVPEAGQRPRLLADVALRVAPAGAEREELHQLAAVVLVRRALLVVGPPEPEQHRRVLRDRDHAAARTSRARGCGRGGSASASAAGSRRRRSRSRTSRARRASSARRVAGSSGPCGRATRGGRGPRRRSARCDACRRRPEPARRAARASRASASGLRRRGPSARASRPHPVEGRNRRAKGAARPERARSGLGRRELCVRQTTGEIPSSASASCVLG